MPRLEKNNPTIRIGRLLDDFDDLEAAYDTAMAIVANEAAWVFETLPPKPSAFTVREEKVRRQLTLAKVESKRESMRRLRSRGEGLAIRHLTKEEEAAIMLEVDRELGDIRAEK